MSPKCSACHAFKGFDLGVGRFLRVSPYYTSTTPAILLKLFYSPPYLKKLVPGLKKDSPNGARRRCPEALKVWQALYFRDIWRKWETRIKKFSEELGQMRRTPAVAEYLHPLLPDPPPILLKHVTKTSIAVPALPVIKPGTPEPIGIHETHTNQFRII